MDNKSLYELAEDYEKSISVLNEVIRETLTQRKKEKLMCNKDGVKSLSRKLWVLYEEKRDAEITAEHLRNYYNVKAENESIPLVCAGG